MNLAHVNFDDFGMDTASLAGPLPSRLAAIREAGFTQVTLSAHDLAGHAGSIGDAARLIRTSGLHVTGFRALRDFEGLSGRLHDYKIDVARAMLEMCSAIGSDILIVDASTSTHATTDPDVLARDLRKLAMLAIPLGIRIAYEALAWGCAVREFPDAWDIVCRADAPNLGIGLDTFHVLAAGSAVDDLDILSPDKVLLVHLADFMWPHAASPEERIETGRHFTVFPGEGAHNAALADFVTRLDAIGYRGSYSFEARNDDYAQLPPAAVCARARRAAIWLSEDVLQRSMPLPNRIRLRGRNART